MCGAVRKTSGLRIMQLLVLGIASSDESSAAEKAPRSTRSRDLARK